MIQDYEAFAVKIISLALKTACLLLSLHIMTRGYTWSGSRIQYNSYYCMYRNVYLPIILYAKYNNDTQSYFQLFHGKSDF